LTFLAEGQLFAQEEILSGKGGAGLQEADQELDEVQTDAVKSQEGMRKGIGEHGTRVPHGQLKFNDLSNFENICVGHVLLSGFAVTQD
jgi:hypothetical protein